MDWWEDLLPLNPHEHPPGEETLLRLVAYDISEPRRLLRIASICEDYGTRVQFSLFECWLDDTRFEELWAKLLGEIEKDSDRIVAYTLDQGAARRRRTGGAKMSCTERRDLIIV